MSNVDVSLWSRLRKFAGEVDDASCVLADAIGRTGGLPHQVKAMWPGAKIAGRAVTARPIGRDLSAVFRAIAAASQDDVIVVGNDGVEPVAMWGENASLFARQRGVVGAVLGIPCRDVTAHSRLGFPIFAVGTRPEAGQFGQAGETMEPVSISGVIIHPGDAIVGDENGVVVVPQAHLGEALGRVSDILEKDKVTQKAISDGSFMNS